MIIELIVVEKLFLAHCLEREAVQLDYLINIPRKLIF
jgi:hypothetical protein